MTLSGSMQLVETQTHACPFACVVVGPGCGVPLDVRGATGLEVTPFTGVCGCEG